MWPTILTKKPARNSQHDSVVDALQQFLDILRYTLEFACHLNGMVGYTNVIIRWLMVCSIRSFNRRWLPIDQDILGSHWPPTTDGGYQPYDVMVPKTYGHTKYVQSCSDGLSIPILTTKSYIPNSNFLWPQLLPKSLESSFMDTVPLARSTIFPPPPPPI